MTTGVPLAALVADVAFARRIAAPLLVVHDMNDAEVPIANGRVYAQAPNARMLATDGLGHRRILRDLHVVDASVRFIAEHHTPLELNIAPLPSVPVSIRPGREHRDMLTDVGAMA